MRIRYPFELYALAHHNPPLGDQALSLRVQHLRANPLDSRLAAAERYAFDGRSGQYELGRTVYVPLFWRGKPSIPPSLIHETVHYLMKELLQRKLGRGAFVRGDPRYVPLDVWEGIAAAFEHRFLEQRRENELTPAERQLLLRNAIRDGKQQDSTFSKDRFLRAYRKASELIELHGFDGAARRIPEIVDGVHFMRTSGVVEKNA